MPNDTTPEWAREMAQGLFVDWEGPGADDIARALVAAERRGLERGLKQARNITYGAGPDYGLFGPGGSLLVDDDNDPRPGSPYDSGRYDAAKLIDASIRKLMESSDEA